jgi:DNA-3-methyladenine glycosylase
MTGTKDETTPSYQGILNGSAPEAASRLLGSELEAIVDGSKIRLRIVETEAYDQTDVASHSFKGQTERTKIMFGPSGYLYVYFTYGMHYCCNVVVGEEGFGAAVLLRAVEPLGDASRRIAKRRPGKTEVEMTNGPAKLCQALGIDKVMNGHDLTRSPLKLLVNPPLPRSMIVTTTRIGIGEGKEVPWRFYIRDNPFVSKK